jgi:1-acyl-sn-glycerol-3-phosphate acyltransferase
MPDLWYQLLSYLCAHMYFSRIEVLPSRQHHRLPGPALLVALHRNGAVDGWVYKSIFRSATFLIAAQLRKNLLARLFFTGITVVRDKDRPSDDKDADHFANTESLNRCYDLLASGGVLAIFPEGTSSLGPRHLPFKSGAARIACEAAQRNLPLTILPLGITYGAPSTFRSGVQVILGQPFSPTSLSVPQLKHEISSRLQSVGINVASDDYHRDMRALATFAAPEIPYHLALKALEPGLPASLLPSWPTLRAALASHALLHPEKSPFSPRSPWLALLVTLLLSPFVLAAALLNALPILAAYSAGRKFPDGPNVITLWRILVGGPLLFIWFAAILIISIVRKSPHLFAAYLAISLAGLFAYAPWKRNLRHSLNAFRSPALRSTYLTFRSTLLQELRPHAS